MSLLDDASLLLTPNAYKEGKLYSVIPSNGNGDFTATRATTATRVNSAGLVDLVPYNLLQQSEMFSQAIWTKTASSVTANTTTAPDGTLTADTLTADGTTNSHLLVQSVSVTSGLSYTLSCYVKRNTNDFVQITFNNFFGVNAFANFNINTGVLGSIGSAATAAIQNVGNGWYRCSVTATATSTGTGNVPALFLVNSATAVIAQSNTLNTSVFIWGAQLVEGTSARDYLRTETRLNIPRIDYSLGGCPNILLEPQRTNLALWSEQFDNAWWGKATLSITSNTTTSPSGVVNADTLDEGTTSSIHRLAGTACTITAGSINSFSLYVKNNNMRYLRLVINDSGDTLRWIAAQFDLETQTFTTGVGITAGSTITSASIQSVGNGWFRVNIVGSMAVATFVLPIVFGSNGAAINSLDGRGGPIYSGTNRTLFIWGAQLEAGAYATSYIPTTTASVTRNADSITRNNIFTNGLITSAGGTWFVELRNNRVLTREGAFNGVIYLGDSNNSGVGNCFRFWGTTSSRFIIQKFISGAATSLFTTTTDTCKLAIKWNGSTADVFQNGVKVVSATAFTATALNFLEGGAQQLPAFINEMALFPTPLTDAQCIALTQ